MFQWKRQWATIHNWPAGADISPTLARNEKPMQQSIMSAKEEKRNPKVDAFLSRTKSWRREFQELRRIILECPLSEELRWGKPCYTFQKNNIVLMHGFKEYCALLFFKGALLKDPDGILVQQTENVQAARQIRFTQVRQIAEMEPILKAYISEAIEVEKAGLKVNYKKNIRIQDSRRISGKIKQEPRLKNRFSSTDAGKAKRIPPLFFCSQTIQNSGGKD